VFLVDSSDHFTRVTSGQEDPSVRVRRTRASLESGGLEWLSQSEVVLTGVVSGYVESNSRLLPEEVSSDGVGLSTPARGHVSAGVGGLDPARRF